MINARAPARRDLKAVLDTTSPRVRRLLVATTVLGFFAGLLEAVGVGAVAPLVVVMTEMDIAARFPQFAQLIPAAVLADRATLIVSAAAVFALVFVTKSALSLWATVLQARMRGQVSAELASKLFADYLAKPYAFHFDRSVADIHTRLVHGVQAAAGALHALAQLVLEGIVLVAILGLLLYLSPLAALGTVAVIGLPAYAVHRALTRRVRATGAEMQELYRQNTEATLHALGGIKELKILEREAQFHARFTDSLARLALAEGHYGAVVAAPRLALELAMVFGLLGLAALLAVQGNAGAIAPVLAVYAAAAFRALPALSRVLGGMQQLHWAAPGLRTVTEDLAQNSGAVTLPAPSTSPLRLTSELRLDGVTFGYGRGVPPVFSDVQLAIRPGDVVGITGPTGAGKSTLVDVMLGLLEPSAGRITVDRNDIRTRLRDWQANIGYVPQSIFLLDDTLGANVAFGVPEAEVDERRIWQVLEIAQLAAFVRAQPDGLNARVGERGVRLSGGERQRVGIARALYRQPGLLVLDEATSALDVGTEQQVLAAVLDQRGSMAVVVVAHRPGTIERCDCAYVLDRGRLMPTKVAHAVSPKAAVM